MKVMSEFKGTKGEWMILTKGNTVQQLAIENDRGDKVCGNISPKRKSDAQLIVDAGNVRQQINFDLPELLRQRNEMLGMLQDLLATPETGIYLYGTNAGEKIEKLIKEATEL